MFCFFFFHFFFQSKQILGGTTVVQAMVFPLLFQAKIFCAAKDTAPQLPVANTKIVGWHWHCGIADKKKWPQSQRKMALSLALHLTVPILENKDGRCFHFQEMEKGKFTVHA